MSVQAIITETTGYVDGSQVRIMALYENKTVEGIVKVEPMKYDGANCSINPADIYEFCTPVTKWNLKELIAEYVTGMGIFNYGCIRTSGCTSGGCVPCSSWDGAAGSFKWGIAIRAYDPTKPGAPPNLVVTPQSGALNIKWDPVTNVDVFAYQVIVMDGSTVVAAGYTESTLRNVTVGNLTNGKSYTINVEALSHSYIFSATSSKTGTPAGATNAQVYNIQTTPESPKAGDSMTIKASIANTGPNGKVRAVFKVDGSQISDQNSTLNTYPGGGLWEPTAPYTMPNKTITITVEGYGWDGSKWVLTDTKSITRTPAAPSCTGVTLTPYSAAIKEGEKVTFTATVTPSTSPFTVQFKDRAGALLGSCTTSGGSCQFVWDSAGKTLGTYYVKAYVVEGSCVSTESVIELAPAIRQWNVNIYVRDANTNNPIEGASVTIGTQTKQTDAAGFVQFRVNEGSIYITISKTGYNTFTTTEPVFSDKTFNYTLAPVGVAKGSIKFVSVPSGAEIFVDGVDKGVKTPYTVTDIPAGKHTFCLKLTGYNDTCGEVTVVGGVTVEVYATLTPVTPTTGSLNIMSTPGGAAIYIDAAVQEPLTPATITNITPGSHTVKLTKEGYEDFSTTVTITAGTTSYLSATLKVLPGIGALEISSTPSGARVFIDDKDQELVTPATVTNLPSGSHAYKLVLAGYKDATGTFNIEAGKTATVAVTLKKEAAPSEAGRAVLGIGIIAVLGVTLYAATRD